ncbi:MAG: hypothetical protein HPZ91_16195 [Lentisphaeria bacterium]|nr:hypothetical protein [Lentisphaeria bacterium]
MNEFHRDDLKIDNSGTSFGVTNGNVTNDNRTMNGNTLVAGNQINNNLSGKWNIPLVCITVIAIFLIFLTAFTIWCITDHSESVSNNAIIQIGPRGGVYYVTESGIRKYIDREYGMKLYQEQQKEAEDGIH